MKTIWKFVMPAPICHIEMPVGAEIVRLGRQGPQVCIWAIVESDVWHLFEPTNG